MFYKYFDNLLFIPKTNINIVIIIYIIFLINLFEFHKIIDFLNLINNLK